MGGVVDPIIETPQISPDRAARHRTIKKRGVEPYLGDVYCSERLMDPPFET